MSPAQILHRAYHHPLWIPMLSVFAVLSLVGTTVLLVLFVDDQADRNRERILSDIAACERGNELRVQTIGVGLAGEALVDGVVDEIAEFAQLDVAEKNDLDARLAPLFDEYMREIDAIHPVNCQAVTPGGREPGG